jgi:CheY-like chemotaxis protein
MTAKLPTIVAIDHSPASLSLYRRSVAPLDIALLTFSSPAKSLAFLADHSVDLVFLDILMRDMDGLMMLRTLRGMELHHSTAVVIVTSKDYAQDRGIAEQLGSREYRLKPLRSQEIREIISRYVGSDSRGCDDFQT